MISNICSMCGEEEETTSHLFCTCRVAWLVWFKCFEWTGLASTNYWESKQHFLNFKMGGVNERVNQTWGCVWITVVGELWEHGNKRIFNSGRIYHNEIFTLAQLKACS